MDCEIGGGMTLSDSDFKVVVLLSILFCSCVSVNYWIDPSWGKTGKVFCHSIFPWIIILGAVSMKVSVGLRLRISGGPHHLMHWPFLSREL